MLGKVGKFLKKLVDIIVLGRQAGLWNEKHKVKGKDNK